MWLFIEEGVKASPCCSCAYLSLSLSSIKPLTVQCYVLNLNNTWSKLLCCFNVYYVYEPSYGELYYLLTYIPSCKLLNYTGSNTHTHTYKWLNFVKICQNSFLTVISVKNVERKKRVLAKIITKKNLSILYLRYQIIPLRCSLSKAWLSSNSPKDFRRRLKFKINTTWHQQATISTST